MRKVINKIKLIWSVMRKMKCLTQLDIRLLLTMGLLVVVVLQSFLVFAAPNDFTVTYSVLNDWGSGATVNVTIQNNGTTAIQGWKLEWAFAGNQKISNLWNGKCTQNGNAVAVENAGYNATIAANGGTVNFGFNLTYSGTNTKPTTFILNGTASGGSPTPTATPTATLTATPTATPSPTATADSGSYVWDYGDVPSATIEPWNDNPTLTPININPYGKPALTIPYGYILLNEGPNGTAQVPKETQIEILKRVNEDLKWECLNLGFRMPPWTTGKTGNKYIDYFFTNTGLPKDPGPSGYQGWEGSYPCVVTDANGMSDRNRYNLTHEFNHVILNSYGTIPGNSVSWIHESLNNYMILRLAQWRSGGTAGQAEQFPFPPGIGYLDAEVYKQPYVPIESCGINSAGEATGPGDYFNDSTGYRYNDLFPLFVSQRVGMTFYARVIAEAKPSEQNLQTMTRLLDKQRVQAMVTEYAARLALGDFMEFSHAIQGVASTAMYAATTNQDGWLVPTDKNKLPRYTGRNNIPIAVNQGATEVTVEFAPDAQGSNGTPADVRAQIVYRATDGTTVFSTPVASGKTTLKLTKPPKYGVVIVVITNVTMSGYKKVTSYGWDPTEKFGYKIKVTGGTAAPISRLYF